MFDRIASSLLRFRIPLLVLLAVVAAVLATKAIQVRFDFSPRSIFLTADTELEFLNEHRDVFGNEDGTLMVLIEAEDVFAATILQHIASLSVEFEDLPDIERVLSLSTMREIHGSPGAIEITRLYEDLPETPAELEALSKEERAAVDAELAELRERTITNRLFRHRFVNPEGTATAILAIFDQAVIEELDRRPTLNKIEELLKARTSGEFTAQLVGVPVVNREYAVRLQGDMAQSIGLSGLLLVLVLFVLFRNRYSVILPLGAVSIAIAMTVGYMVLAGDSFDIINSIVPTLLLVIGIGDAVHFLTTYYQELGAGEDKRGAVHRMVRRIGAACLLTSVTAAIGFASLMVARIDIIKGMGRVAAVGLMISYVVILILVPTVLSLVEAPKAAVSRDLEAGVLGRLLARIARLVVERKVAIVGFTFGVIVLCIFGAQRVKTDNFLLEELFDRNPVSQAMHRAEDILTGVMPVEIAIHTTTKDEDGNVVDLEYGVLDPEILRGMVELQAHMGEDPFIGHSVSIADLIREIGAVAEGNDSIPDTRAGAIQRLLYFEMSEDPSFLDSMVDGPRSRARISSSQRDWGTNNFFAWYEGGADSKCHPQAKCGTPMRALIDQVFGTTDGKKDGLEVHITGSNLVAARALSKLVDDMLFSLGTAFAVISILMMLLLRSFRIGLLSMLPNLIPLLMCIGFMGWVGIPIRTSTALIFSVALGVAVNDTIHFVTRFREELFRTGDRKEAVRRTIMSTGRAILFTSIVMIFGFGTMMTTDFVGIFQMGLLGVVTLSAALIGDLLLLPVMLVVFRPWERFIEKKQREGTWEPVEVE